MWRIKTKEELRKVFDLTSSSNPERLDDAVISNFFNGCRRTYNLFVGKRVKDFIPENDDELRIRNKQFRRTVSGWDDYVAVRNPLFWEELRRDVPDMIKITQSMVLFDNKPEMKRVEYIKKKSVAEVGGAIVHGEHGIVEIEKVFYDAGKQLDSEEEPEIWVRGVNSIYYNSNKVKFITKKMLNDIK